MSVGAAAGAGTAAGPVPPKILVVGPSKSRKSALCSFLAGVTDGIGESPGATIGVRILEIERGGTTVELWDVSGDQSYESSWPAIQKDASAVLLVYAPDMLGSAKELELWYDWFATKRDIPFDRVLCYSLAGESGGGAGAGATPTLGPVPVERHNIEAADAIRKSFDRFLGRLMTSLSGGSGAGGRGGARR